MRLRVSNGFASTLRTPEARVVAVLAALLLAVVAIAGTASLTKDPTTPGADSPAGPRGQLSDAGRLEVQPAAPTTFRVSSFNLLGDSHTAPGGDRKGWASGTKRMGWAVQLIKENGLDLVGFQEMQRPQYEVFKKRLGATYRLYPGIKYGNAVLANSLAWPKADWAVVEKRTVTVPYFHGRKVDKPLVLLRNRMSGQLVWFFNTHNPANAFGQAQKWRDAAVKIQIAMVNDLRAERPGVPVLFTGDMNDRTKFFCPITSGTELRAANGGVNAGNRCTLPVPNRVDWVMGTSDVRFTGYTDLVSPLVKKTTDHALIFADATLPSPAAQQAGIRRVVVLDVQGLPSKALASTALTPRIHQMMAEGTSTLNARTTTERTTSLPNVVSILTGRPVRVSAGGHGVIKNKPEADTVAAAAGGYVWSAFDRVHDFGLSTALLANRERIDLLDHSWDSKRGRLDTIGVDNGRDKIDRYLRATDDAETFSQLDQLLTRAKQTLTFTSLTEPARVGQQYGYESKQYRASLSELDTAVGAVLDRVAGSSKLASSTLVILTADTGGQGRSSRDRTVAENFTVPLVAWGAPVVAGGDLYALNPAYGDPGTAQVGYDRAPTPIRTAAIANLVTGVLGLPAVPGSRFNLQQDLNVFVGPEPPTPTATPSS